MNPEINRSTWSNPVNDDFRLLDSFLSPTINGISNFHNFSFNNHDTFETLTDVTKQQNNNSSQLINVNDEKQLIGPLGSNL